MPFQRLQYHHTGSGKQDDEGYKEPVNAKQPGKGTQENIDEIIVELAVKAKAVVVKQRFPEEPVVAQLEVAEQVGGIVAAL
jgi:hypothetical protein